MKIYLASGDAHTVKSGRRILLSYYDIHLSKIPFRKETFKLIKSYEDKQK